MKFEVISDHVAVIPSKRADRVVNGIVIPAGARDPFVVKGKVLRVGPGFVSRTTGVRSEVMTRPGDTVVYLREGVHHTYEGLEVDGQYYEAISILQERDVNVVIRDGEIIALGDYIVGEIIPRVEDNVFREGHLAIPYRETEGGLLIADSAAVKKAEDTERLPVRVRATHVGPGQWSKSNKARIPTDVNVGDVVLCSKYMAWEFQLDEESNKGYVVIKADQVHGIETE